MPVKAVYAGNAGDASAFRNLSELFANDAEFQAETRSSFLPGSCPAFLLRLLLYSYATDICISCRVAEKITAGDKEEPENCKNFLSAGKSLPTVELYRLLGVDIVKPDCIKVLTDRYSELPEMEEELLKTE